MFFIKILVCLVFCLPISASAQSLEVSPAVERTREATWAICNRLYITANFRDKPREEKSTLANYGEGCATAFQVSETEIITAAHTIGDARASLFGYFANQMAMYLIHHGLTFDHKIPVGDIQVEYFIELISSEGLTLRSATTKYTIGWNNADPDEKALQDFFNRLQQVTLLTGIDQADFHLNHIDEQMDLAYLRIEVPFIRSRYIEVVQEQFSMHTLVWGVNAREPTQFSGGLPGLDLVQSSIREVGIVPNIEGGRYLKPNIWTYNLATDTLNTSGVSGGPNVTADGKLVGVTHAGGSHENLMANFEVIPTCNVPMFDGQIFPCNRFVIAGHFVYQFLEDARNKK